MQTIKFCFGHFSQVSSQVFMILITSIFLCIFGLNACGDNQDSQKQSQEQVVTKTPPPFELKGKLSDLTFPAQLVAIGGFNQIEQVSTKIKTSLTSFLPTPLDLRAMWLDNYVQTEMLLDPKFIHAERPLRFIELVSEGSIHTVRLIGINSIKNLQESLGQYVTTKDIDGKQVFVQNRYKDDKTPLYFTELKHNMIASTYHPKLLSKEYLQFYNEVASTKVDGLINAIFFPKKAGENWQGFAEGENQLAELELKGSARSVARQKNTLKNILNLAKQVALDSEKTSLTVNIDQPRVSFDVDWALKAGSTSALMLTQLKGSEHQLLKYASGASFLLSLQLPKTTLQLIIQEWNRLALSTIQPKMASQNSKSKKNNKNKKKKRAKNLAPVLSESLELVSDYLKLTQDASQHLAGSLLLATIPFEQAQKNSKTKATADDEALDESLFLPPTNAKALRWLGLFGHSNQAQISEQINKILSVYQVPEIAKNMKKRGLKINIKEERYESNKQVLQTTHIKTRMPRTSPILRPLRPQLKELYNAHLWITENLGAVGFANSWKQSFDRLLQALNQQDAQMDSLIAQAVKAGLAQPSLFLYLDPLSTIGALKRGKAGSILLPLQMMFAAAKPSEGLSLTLQANQQSLKARLNVPHSLLNAIKAGMSGTGLSQ